MTRFYECFNGCFLLEKVSSKAYSGTTSNPIIQPRLAEYIVCASLTKLLTLEIVSDREGNCHNLYCPCNNKMLLIQKKHLLQKKEEKKIGSRFFGLSSRMVMIRKNQMHLCLTQLFWRFQIYILTTSKGWKHFDCPHFNYIYLFLWPTRDNLTR